MQLSKNTLAILKNFAGINQNLLLVPGQPLVTHAGNTFVADAEVEETFDVQFGIYDLNEFLGILSLFGTPDIEFDAKCATITEGGRSATYWATGPSVIPDPPKIRISDMPEPDLAFDFPATLMAQIQRAASVLKVPDLSIVGDGSEIRIQIVDKKNPSSNIFSTVVGETDKNFDIGLKVEDLRLLNIDYKFSIRNRKIAVFEGVLQPIHYFNAIRKESKLDF